MANYKTNYTQGYTPTPYCGEGEIRAIPISYTPTVNLAIGDIVELVDLDDATQVVDWAVWGVPTSLVGSLGELNAGKTALSTTWKAGVSGIQRADSAAHLANTSGKRRAGLVVTTAATAQTPLNATIFVRAV